MKKTALTLLVLIGAGTIYYFTAGSAQLTNEMKQRVNTQLSILQNEGFGVEHRKAEAQSEHFVLTISNPEKIAAYMTKQGMTLDAQDAKTLQGLGLGVDVHYLPNTLDAIALDIYPTTLPQSLVQDATSEEDKKTVATLQNLFDKKTFLVHVTFDKLLSGFKGNMKDIHETLASDTPATLTMEGFTFDGSINQEKQMVQKMTQNLKRFSIEVPNELMVNFAGLRGDYALTGASKYDTLTHYAVDAVSFKGEGFTMQIDKLIGESDSTQVNTLLNASGKSTVQSISIDSNSSNIKLDNLAYGVRIANLDVDAVEQLSQIDPNDQTALNGALQKLLAQDIVLNIDTFGVEKIQADNKALGGFGLNGSFMLAKGLDINAIQNDPAAAMAAMNAFSSKITLDLSKELFELLGQEPEAMMAVMMFPPKEKNGQKSYEIEFNKGALTVNGVAVQ